MTARPEGFHSLSRRIVVIFCVFSVALSLIFGLITFVLLYTLEDNFIARDIKQEAAFLAQGQAQTGDWPAPRKSSMQLYFSRASFPEDIRALAVEEPGRIEFYGEDGRHYHVHALVGHPNVYLVAEVSGELLVRPIRDGVIKFLTTNGVIVTFVAFVIAWLIGRKTTKPLKRLADLADRVLPEDVPKDFASQFPNNEIGTLARTLERSWQRIADALDREKHFTRDVSHELRSPLAVMKNAVEVARSHPSNVQADEALLRRIAEAAEQMEKTVQTLLVLAREEHAGEEKMDVSLMSVVETSVLDNRALLEGKSVDVNINDNCHVKLATQPGMLKVLVDNLLSNAFQYTDSGEVNVSFEKGELIVKDTGPGIDPGISAKVTEPAVKGSQSQGFGFGLAIVKRLCEHQGWMLSVSSGQGTRIAVSLERSD